MWQEKKDYIRYFCSNFLYYNKINEFEINNNNYYYYININNNNYNNNNNNPETESPAHSHTTVFDSTEVVPLSATPSSPYNNNNKQ